MTEFVNWAGPILDQLRTVPMLPRSLQRRGHREGPTMEQIREFEAWDDAFQRIRERGIERGWLDEDGDSTPPMGTWVYDEPEDEYLARLQEWREQNTPDGTVTFRVHRETDDG